MFLQTHIRIYGGEVTVRIKEKGQRDVNNNNNIILITIITC